MQLCKIRFDGNHHLAMRYKNISAQKLDSYFPTEMIINVPKQYLGLKDNQNKKDLSSKIFAFFKKIIRDFTSFCEKQCIIEPGSLDKEVFFDV